MNEDYLWDKTGEVDPEVERFERALSSLRYQRPATPLPLPQSSPRFFRRNLRPALAIAATLAILLLAGGLWFALHRASDGQRNTVADRTKTEADQATEVVSGPPPTTGPVNTTGDNVVQNEDEQVALPSSPAPRKIYRRAPAEQQQRLASIQTANNLRRAARERQIRGEEAKAQLIMALHIASDKLNTVQKKIQGNQERGPIS